MKKVALFFVLTFFLLVISKSYSQTIPEIFCPSDIIVSNDLGNCSALVSFADATATDAEDGILTTMQTLGLVSGSEFPVGDSIIEFSATDTDANTVTCQFTITVEDTEVPIVVCNQDYEVELDADGLAIINASDLIESVEENCSYSVGGSPLPCVQTQSSNAFENGSAVSQNHISANDITVNADQDLTVYQITANLFHPVGEMINSIDFIYYFDNAGVPGTEIGSQSAIIPTSQSVIGANFGLSVSQVIVDIIPFVFESQIGIPTTYWIGVKATSTGGNVFWETSSASGNGNNTMLFDENNSMWEVFAGMDGVYTFTAEGNGNCGYNFPLEFDCSNLGENIVDVIVTDTNGNATTVTTTVIVSDITAPILVCGTNSLLYGSNSISENQTYYHIPDNDPNGVSATLTITDDFTLTDLDIEIYIGHTAIGDLQITLISPLGSTLVLFDQLCGGTDNLDIIFDDEGDDDSNVSCSDLNNGYHLDIASIVGYDPLSVFDGESLLGDWTLNVIDNVAGETGYIYFWGLNYEYSYPNPSDDILIELDENGQHTITLEDMTDVAEDNCGISAFFTTVQDVDCSDIGAPISVMTLVTDLSGNVSNCTHDISVVDTMPPYMNCPGDHTVHHDNNGFYEIPDYYALNLAFASDNCTQTDDIIFTQFPIPGSIYGVTQGTANPPVDVIFTAIDEYGNESICQFELEIGHNCSVEDSNSFNDFISLYPNPSSNKITIINTSDIKLQQVLIYDIKGKLLNQYMINSLQNTLAIDVSHYSKGVYLVSILTEDQSKTIKRLLIK